MKKMKDMILSMVAVCLLSGAMACNKIPDKDMNYHFIPKDTNPTDAAPVIIGTFVTDSIVPGLAWKNFTGRDTEVTGEPQVVNVLEMDMTSPRLHLKFHYGNSEGDTTDELSPAEIRALVGVYPLYGCESGDGQRATDEVFAHKRLTEGAVACVNGAYEVGSVWIRTNGKPHAIIGSSIVPGHTRIPQWKSEAIVCSDGNQNIKIFNPGANAWDIAQQRSYYRSIQSDWPNMFGSSPLLIWEGQPVGESFVDKMKQYAAYKNNTNDSECPIKHQGADNYPRTVIALVEDNPDHEGCDKCMLITVDGRSNAAHGFSAATLTRFILHYFPNTQYALNMDGGGSTCMCVLGRGEPTTNVVNYPCDNLPDYDHFGVRSVNSHFYITYDQPEPDGGEGGGNGGE